MSKEDFDAIDADGDGFITASEMLIALGNDPNVSADDIATIVTMARRGRRQQDHVRGVREVRTVIAGARTRHSSLR